MPSIGYYLHEWKCQDGFHGAPSLVIELLSPGTAHYDLHEKKFVYERHGVQEYWIVDPDTKEVDGYFLENAKYGEAVRLNGTITSRLLGQDFDF
ncbi:MAG TPA: Uma2 family endonuclease [Membranihabitans sp.]|nr:Uma2 family endonuclease [Membranihabitans sp.]